MKGDEAAWPIRMDGEAGQTCCGEGVPTAEAVVLPPQRVRGAGTHGPVGVAEAGRR